MSKVLATISGLFPGDYKNQFVTVDGLAPYWCDGNQFYNLLDPEALATISELLQQIADNTSPNATEAKQDTQITELNKISLNTLSEETGFLTTALLAGGATYTSPIIDVDGKSQVQTEILSDTDGTITISFCSDAAGLNVVRSLSIPYVASNGYQFFSAPAFVNFIKYEFTNNGILQTQFYYTSKILNTAISPQLLTVEGSLSPTMVTTAVRPTSDYNTDRNIGIILGQESKRKFGVNESVGNTLETIWSYGSNWIPNQVINEKLRIAAGGNAADTAAGLGAQSVVVNFLDENWLEVTETLVTAGASVSADTTANCVRLISAKVANVGTYHGSNTGDIVFELNGSGNIMGNMKAETGTTEQAILPTPANKNAFITEIFVSVGQGNSSDVKMFILKNSDDLTTPFSAAITQWTLEDFSGAEPFKLDTHFKIEPKSDVWFEAEKVTGGGNARVSVDFNYYTVNI